MPHILTLDLGTTYFKAGLFDREGRMCALYREAPPIRCPRPGRCELDAADFRAAVRRSIAAVGASSPDGLRDVAAVTFATQTNSFVLLDADDQPLTPIILWPDDRAAVLTDHVRSIAELPAFRATTGLAGLGTEFMAAKLHWLRGEQPDVWARIRRLCLISDYLTLWLTGRHVTEAGAAGLTAAMDIHHLTWWPEAAGRMDLSSAWLPQIVRAGADLGPLRSDIVEDLGLPRTCRFVVGCLDQFAGAIGAGNIEPGGVSETTGTVLATVRCSQGFTQNVGAGVFQGPAFDAGVYYQMVFGSRSANLLESYRNRLPDRPAFDALDRLAANVPPGADGLRVLPGAESRSDSVLFEGRSDHHTTGHQVRAILEAVALALAAQVDQLCGGQRPAIIRCGGGAARSDLWLQIKADVLGIPTAALECPEPTSLGTAILAARALVWGRLEELARQWVRVRPAHQPDPQTHLAYARCFPRHAHGG